MQKSERLATIVNVRHKFVVNMGVSRVSAGGSVHAFVSWIKWSLHKAATACFRRTVLFVATGL